MVDLSERLMEGDQVEGKDEGGRGRYRAQDGGDHPYRFPVVLRPFAAERHSTSRAERTNRVSWGGSRVGRGLRQADEMPEVSRSRKLYNARSLSRAARI